jgi:hypothetical protein
MIAERLIVYTAGQPVATLAKHKHQVGALHTSSRTSIRGRSYQHS